MGFAQEPVYVPPASFPSPVPPPPRGPLQRALNKCGMDCWAHHFYTGCGSFHSEMRFIFGSCHAWYGQPCIPQPPHADRNPYWRNPCLTGNCNP